MENRLRITLRMMLLLIKEKPKEKHTFFTNLRSEAASMSSERVVLLVDKVGNEDEMLRKRKTPPQEAEGVYCVGDVMLSMQAL